MGMSVYTVCVCVCVFVCDFSSPLIFFFLCPQWHSLSREEQAKYYELARKERQLHSQLYPGWSARDNYVSETCPSSSSSSSSSAPIFNEEGIWDKSTFPVKSISHTSLINETCWSGWLSLWKKLFLTCLFYVCRESGKRGRETTNLTQNQKVRGLNYYYYYFYSQVKTVQTFVFQAQPLLCYLYLSLSPTDSLLTPLPAPALRQAAYEVQC